jgi:hypothetical protein
MAKAGSGKGRPKQKQIAARVMAGIMVGIMTLALLVSFWQR